MYLRQVSKIRQWIAIGLVTVLAACSATYQNHGYVPTDDELANLLVGVDTQNTVAEIIGRPSSTGVLENSGWYYISTRVRNFTYHKAEVIDRQMLAISFDGKGVVSNIERFSMKDGRVIALSRRVTSSGIKGPGFFSQLIGNIGNFGVGDFLEDDG